MNREQQIRSKAKELGQTYFPDEANVWARGNIEAEYVESACVEMAEWLDQHPQWIPVEERLPRHNEEENGLISYQSVLVCLYDGYRTEDYYDDIRGKWGDYDGEVEYWMPMPPAPAKKGSL